MNSIYEQRLNRHIKELRQIYFKVYKKLGATKKDFDALLNMMSKRFLDRSDSLHQLDLRPSKWYMSKDMIGYMVYTDLFAGDLKKLESKIEYLQELGITYVHLMPLLKTREGENDGGYAVEDYLDIDPILGTHDDFNQILTTFREAHIDVCIDYVINHTADTHQWAKKALEGDKYYQDMYMMFDDRSIPDIYDKYVPEVLPDKCPGNFTFKKEINKWVFTSFSSFQWDLNFKNPKVFENMVDIMLQLANKGVNIIRLDAIPFMWKEAGTNCRNLGPIHDLIHMFHIIKDVVAPSLAILGEAIVEPHEIFKYFGDEHKEECGLLYNANFMVNIWNAFATRDVRLINDDNKKYIPPKHSCWMNYLRCHDDIGWGFNEELIESFGLSAFHHKQYLIDFYGNRFPGSFAKGEIYQYNEVNKDARINGTAASLLGLEKAIDEQFMYEQEISIKRILLGHAMIIAHQGIPLIYSGDEIASLNDHTYLNDPDKKNEGRWVHRQFFDWTRATKRLIHNTFEHRVFSGIQEMINIRKTDDLFNGDVAINIIENDDISVYSFYKKTDHDHLICIFNFSEQLKHISTTPYQKDHFSGLYMDLFSHRPIDFSEVNIKIAPYEVLWLKKAE